MSRTPSATHPTLLAGLCVLALTCPAQAEGPGPLATLPDAGPAHLVIQGAGIELGNDAITGRWSAQGGLRATRVDDTWSGLPPLPGGEAFTLRFADGRSVAGSAFTVREGPRRIELASDPKASRLAERQAGIAVVVELTEPASGLAVTWRALLRHGSPYLRTELTLAAGARDVALSEIVLAQFPGTGWKAGGTVAGSPVVEGSRYFAAEHPMAETALDEHGARSFVRRKLPLRRGASVVYSAVVGTAPPSQLRRGLLAYVERERARPYRPFLHYNSWYDIGYFTPYSEEDCRRTIRTWGRELTEQRGVQLASFLFDDGWDDPATVWEFHRGFPHGFLPLREEAARFGAGLGVWLSPWGGYGKPREARLATGRAAGYEVDEQGYALSGPRYFARFRAVTLDLLARYGINQFKLDGTGSPDKTTPASAFDSDFAAAISLIDELRAAQPGLFVNLTTGTWPSPFWLRSADSIWRGGWDHEFAGVGSARQRWITYRDADTFGGVVAKAPLFPLTSLMLHGVIYARHARDLESDPAGDLRAELRSYFGSGTQLQELYVSPDLLTPADWDDLAEAASWARDRTYVLVDTHWVGGDPAQLEVYGWAAWAPQRGILTLRNPADRPQAVSLEVDRLFELPPGAPARFVARRPWREQREVPALELESGVPRVIELAPFEVLTLEATPAEGSATGSAVRAAAPAPSAGVRADVRADRRRLACLGESGAPDSTSSWCRQLASRLGGSVVFSRLAASSTLADLSRSLDDLSSSSPGRIVVLPGSGEVAAGSWPATRDSWGRDLRTLLERLARLPGGPEVAVLRPDPQLAAPASGARAVIEREFAPLAAQAAREAGAKLVDLAFLVGESDAAGRDQRVADSAWLALADARARKSGWKAKADNEGGDWAAAGLAIDGEPATYWITKHWRGGPRHPHTLEVDLGSEQRIAAVALQPPQDGSVTGRIRQLELFTSRDGRSWGEPRIERTLPDSGRAVRLAFAEPVSARYLKLVAWSEVNGGRGTALAEIDVLPPSP